MTKNRHHLKKIQEKVKKNLKILWNYLKTPFSLKEVLKGFFESLLLCSAIGLAVAFILAVGTFIYEQITVKNILVLDNTADFVQIFNVILAFSAIIGYGTYRIIRNVIISKCKADMEEERYASKAEYYMSTGYILWYHWRNTNNRKNSLPKVVEKNTNNETINYNIYFLETAIAHARSSVTFAEYLTNTSNFIIKFKCKNDLAYYLAEQNDYLAEQNEKNTRNKKEALELGQEVYDAANDEKYKRVNATYRWIETYAYVLWKFYKDDPYYKNKAADIMTELLFKRDIPPEYRESTIKEWELEDNYWKEIFKEKKIN